MGQSQIDVLGRLNRYQIAGLAVASSTVAAVTVLVALRRFLSSPTSSTENVAWGTQQDGMEQPSTPEAMGSRPKL